MARDAEPSDKLLLQQQSRRRDYLFLFCLLDHKDLITALVSFFALAQLHLVEARLEGLLVGVGDDGQLREEGEEACFYLSE